MVSEGIKENPQPCLGPHWAGPPRKVPGTKATTPAQREPSRRARGEPFEKKAGTPVRTAALLVMGVGGNPQGTNPRQNPQGASLI